MSPERPPSMLISARSPSVARAQEEFDHPSPTGDPQVVALLARLSEAEENAGRACSKAAERLVDPSLVAQVQGENAMHQAHRASLGAQIEALGGSPPTTGECRQILTQGADAVDGAESEPAAMEALRVMRGELSAAYSEAIGDPHLDDALRATLTGLRSGSGQGPGPARPSK